MWLANSDYDSSDYRVKSINMDDSKKSSNEEHVDPPDMLYKWTIIKHINNKYVIHSNIHASMRIYLLLCWCIGADACNMDAYIAKSRRQRHRQKSSWSPRGKAVTFPLT